MNHAFSFISIWAKILVKGQSRTHNRSVIGPGFLSLINDDRMWGKRNKWELRFVKWRKRNSTRPFWMILWLFWWSWYLLCCFLNVLFSVKSKQTYLLRVCETSINFSHADFIITEPRLCYSPYFYLADPLLKNGTRPHMEWSSLIIMIN